MTGAGGPGAPGALGEEGEDGGGRKVEGGVATVEGGVATDILAVAPGCPLGQHTVARTGLLAGLLTGWLGLDRQEQSVESRETVVKVVSL